jgi:hypothetical protein
MTYYHAATNAYVNVGNPFQIAGVQYPANWLELTGADEKQAVGLTEVSTSGTPADPKFFFTTEELVNGVRVITNTPKPTEMVDAVDARAVEELKDRVRKLRKEIFDRLIGIAFAAKEAGDTPTVQHCLTARAGLLAITDSLPTDPAAAELTLFGRYLAIREALPEALKNTFAGLDL